MKKYIEKSSGKVIHEYDFISWHENPRISEIGKPQYYVKEIDSFDVKHVKSIKGHYVKFNETFYKHGFEDYQSKDYIYIRIKRSELEKVHKRQNEIFDEAVNRFLKWRLRKFFTSQHLDVAQRLDQLINTFQKFYTTEKSEVGLIQIMDHPKVYRYEQYFKAFHSINNEYDKRGLLSECPPNGQIASNEYVQAIGYYKAVKTLKTIKERLDEDREAILTMLQTIKSNYERMEVSEWLSQQQATSKIDWTLLSNELNENHYTIGANPDALKSFFGIDIVEKISKINWNKRHSSGFSRVPLFALIYIIDSVLLIDINELLDRLNTHFTFGKNKESEEYERLKSALSQSWNSKTSQEKKTEVKKLKSKLLSLTSLTN